MAFMSVGPRCAFCGTNVHTIALQIPIAKLTRGGSVPKNVMSSHSTIGIWAGASRRKMQVRADKSRKGAESGPWVQVSRLGNPLFNEVLVSQTRKDEWNRSDPIDDKHFADGVLHPELSGLLPARCTRTRSPIWLRLTRPRSPAPT